MAKSNLQKVSVNLTGNLIWTANYSCWGGSRPPDPPTEFKLGGLPPPQTPPGHWGLRPQTPDGKISAEIWRNFAKNSTAKSNLWEFPVNLTGNSIWTANYSCWGGSRPPRPLTVKFGGSAAEKTPVWAPKRRRKWSCGTINRDVLFFMS